MVRLEVPGRQAGRVALTVAAPPRPGYRWR